MNNNTLCFVASNHSASINRQLTLSIIQDFKDIEYLEIQSYHVPMYSQDLERDSGFPETVKQLAKHIRSSHRLIIATNEHNGAISAFFKNIFDWLTRWDIKLFADKKIIVLSTSEGQRGGLSANKYLSDVLARNGAHVIASITFPSFSKNFDIHKQIISNQELKQKIHQQLQSFLNES